MALEHCCAGLALNHTTQLTATRWLAAKLDISANGFALLISQGEVEVHRPHLCSKFVILNGRW